MHISKWFLGALFVGATLSAQTPAGPVATPAPLHILGAFGLSDGTVQDLQLPSDDSGPGLQVVVTLDGEPETLQLVPHDVRDSNVRLWRIDGNGTQLVPPPPSVTYRGRVLGEPGSRVAASYFDGGFKALIMLGTDLPTYGVDPLREVDPSASANEHLVYRAADVQAQGRCGLSELDVPVAPQAVTGQLDMVRIADIACECDSPYMAQRGNNTNTANASVTSVINAVAVYYLRDVEIDYNITNIFFNIGTDPFTTTNGDTLLGQFQLFFQQRHGTTTRDVAHLFSGAKLRWDDPGRSLQSRGWCADSRRDLQQWLALRRLRPCQRDLVGRSGRIGRARTRSQLECATLRRAAGAAAAVFRDVFRSRWMQQRSGAVRAQLDH